MKQNFVKLTYEILQNEKLTSTDKIVLAYNLGHEAYFASTKYAAETLGMTTSTVKKSITKLKKLGLWRDESGHPGSQLKDTRVAGVDTRVTNPVTRVAEEVTRVADKKPFSPMKTEVLLDSILDDRLDRDKIARSDSASEAANRPSSSSFKDSYFKTAPEVSYFNKTGSASFYNNKEALTEATAPTFTGGGANRREMVEANWNAVCDGRCPPYSDEQLMKAPLEPVCGLLNEFELMFGTNEVLIK